MGVMKGESMMIEIQLAVIIFLLGLTANRLSHILIELKSRDNEPLKERRAD